MEINDAMPVRETAFRGRWDGFAGVRLGDGFAGVRLGFLFSASTV